MSDLFGPSKDELRHLLPVRIVARELVEQGATGPIILADDTAVCPFHGDHDPSFYLWDGDDGIQRWWCQPCGFGGDIFDLIKRLRSCTFPEAVEWARALYARQPPDYVPPKSDPAKNRPTPDTWINTIENARRYAGEKDGLLALRVGFVQASDSPALAHEWDFYLRTTWGWGLSRDGEILMPHWGPKDALDLRGCKTRRGRDGDKGALPGSTFTALYGSWLGRRHQDAILTEGESDAVWTGFKAGREGIALDVYALPAGAGRPPLTEQLDFLDRVRTLYLAFDPDEAGVQATRNWLEALATRPDKFPDVRVCCLPYGRDLRAAQPNLKRLLENAKAPLGVPADVQESANLMGYLRTDAQGNMRQVTSWIVKPIAKLSGGDDPGFDCRVLSRKTAQRTVIRLSDFASTQTLNRWANRHELVFTGSDSDRKALTLHIEALGSICPEVFQTEQVGTHDPPEHYHFAGPTTVYPAGYVGNLPFRYAPTGKGAADVSERVLLPTEAEFDWQWISHFLALSSRDVTEPLLAWIVASMRRHEVQNFPLLFIGGSSGVGKSTLARLAIRLAGSNIEIDLGGITPFILMRTLASTTSIPVFVDEWTRLSRQDTREAFQGIVPSLYTGGMAERGQADLTAMVYRVTAPVVVAGEDTFTLDRELDRTVCIYPTRDAQNSAAKDAIITQPLESFAAAMHGWLLREPDIPPLDYAPAPTRPIYNAQVLLAGWATLRAFVMEHLHAGDAAVPELPDQPDLTCFEHDPELTQENVYEQALLVGLPMKDANTNPVVWSDFEGRGTWLRAVELIGLIESRRLDIQLPGRSRAMLAYFRERYEVKQSKAVTPPGGFSPLSAHLIVGLHLQAEHLEEGDTT